MGRSGINSVYGVINYVIKCLFFRRYTFSHFCVCLDISHLVITIIPRLPLLKVCHGKWYLCLRFNQLSLHFLNLGFVLLFKGNRCCFNLSLGLGNFFVSAACEDRKAAPRFSPRSTSTISIDKISNAVPWSSPRLSTCWVI